MTKKKDDEGFIKDPTTKKIKSRGFKPIKYWIGGRYGAVYYGWIVKEELKVTVIRLTGEEKNRRIEAEERKWITEL